MKFNITRISSKGQVVIPKQIREKMGLIDGKLLAVFQRDNFIVFKKIENFVEEEDLEILSDVKKAWQEIQKGKFKKTSLKNFLKELDKW